MQLPWNIQFFPIVFRRFPNEKGETLKPKKKTTRKIAYECL